ncbi:MAG: RtcB family protein [Parachlamydiaceae bacterium]|nr:RtcB family protein [Parachlamydiaceae bacterium]
MSPNEFNKIVKNSRLTHSESGEAWNIYKNNPQTAVDFVQKILEKRVQFQSSIKLRNSAAPYHIWGVERIESDALDQMKAAAYLPIALAGSLMPDAHKGYGLPIGGVLATENAVIPYAVGVDIACRMMMTVYASPVDMLKKPNSSEFLHLQKALLDNTVFGSGADGVHEGNIDHPILDSSHWESTRLTRDLRLTAIRQIGTSGTGNHFVEWGEFEVTDATNPLKLQPGTYLALLSHSGSRGVGFKIAQHYTKIAMEMMPDLDKSVKHLAWLPLAREEGQEYWNSMHLAGEFASANHHVIHSRIAKAAGLQSIASIENHHNFAWSEKIRVNGIEKDAIVHRKGATPAGKGALGVIPGTMADIGFVVVGKGNPDSLNSASHGSGRQMSRSSAIKTITHQQHADYLARQGVTLIGGGLDEAPQAYKPIQKIIDAQIDLVDIIGTFQPRIVRMAEDKPAYHFRPAPKGIVDAQAD